MNHLEHFKCYTVILKNLIAFFELREKKIIESLF